MRKYSMARPHNTAGCLVCEVIQEAVRQNEAAIAFYGSYVIGRLHGSGEMLDDNICHPCRKMVDVMRSKITLKSDKKPAVFQ